MTPLSIAALSVATGTAFVIWVMARQFARRYAELYRKIPGPTWLFRTQSDPALEAPRRRALALLPVLVISAVIFVVNS